MLSGVGDRQRLEGTGVEAITIFPGRPESADHLDIILVRPARGPCRTASPGAPSCAAGLIWCATRIPGAACLRRMAPGLRGCAQYAGRRGPTCSSTSAPAKLRDHARDLLFLCGEGYSLHVCNLRPKSRGDIRLTSADPTAPLAIRANYLAPGRSGAHAARLQARARILGARAFTRVSRRRARAGRQGTERRRSAISSAPRRRRSITRSAPARWATLRAIRSPSSTRAARTWTGWFACGRCVDRTAPGRQQHQRADRDDCRKAADMIKADRGTTVATPPSGQHSRRTRPVFPARSS